MTLTPVLNTPDTDTLDPWDPMTPNLDPTGSYTPILGHLYTDRQTDRRTAARIRLRYSLTFCDNELHFAIGYGNIAPATLVGRLFCMAYAVVGIPLSILAVADLGKYVVEFAQFVAQQCRTLL